VIKRNTNVRQILASGQVPSELDEIDGDLEAYPQSIVKTSQSAADVYRCIAMGGGGYLDPLDRDPRLVLADVINGVVTPGYASERYGVIVDDANRVDEAATQARRREIREERRATSAVPDPAQRAVRAGGA
jgi:N-methylhydantoinase B